MKKVTVLNLRNVCRPKLKAENEGKLVLAGHRLQSQPLSLISVEEAQKRRKRYGCEKVEMPWEAPELCAASSSQHESS